MRPDPLPPHYRSERSHHQEYMQAVEALGAQLKRQGPLDTKTAHLVQLAAAVAIHSEGAVHSHVRQAMEHGATQAEITHAIILLTSTIGFPTVSAALSWTDDVFSQQ